MKTYVINAFIPEIKAHHAHQSAITEATSIGAAVRRALDEIMKRAEVKGKRITTVKLTIAALDKRKEEEIQETQETTNE